MSTTTCRYKQFDPQLIQHLDVNVTVVTGRNGDCAVVAFTGQKSEGLHVRNSDQRGYSFETTSKI